MIEDCTVDNSRELGRFTNPRRVIQTDRYLTITMSVKIPSTACDLDLSPAVFVAVLSKFNPEAMCISNPVSSQEITFKNGSLRQRAIGSRQKQSP